MKRYFNILLLVEIMALSVIVINCNKDENPIGSVGEITGTFTDGRDNHVYKWVTIGTQTWITENLAYKPSSSNYWAYDNDESNVAVYGYLYSWEITQTIAPTGWHLPSRDEWRTLVSFLGGDDMAYIKLVEAGTSHWGNPNDATNESGFTALPAGYFDQRNNEFRGLGTWTDYFSSTEYSGDSESTMGLALNQNFKDASVEGWPKKIASSIRLIKD